MGKHNEIIKKYFGRWFGSAPAGDYCAHCGCSFVPGADFLIGERMPMSDVQLCGDACAVAELIKANLIAPRSRAMTQPEPWLLQPDATRTMPFETWRLRSEGGK